MTSESWDDAAACRGADPDLFFPDNRIDAARAVKFCNECSVIEHCREFAEATSQKEGVWGGVYMRQGKVVEVGVPTLVCPCGQEFDRVSTNGRPPVFCSPTCPSRSEVQ